MSSSENHSQDKTSRAFSDRNVMSAVRGNPFHSHVKFKVSFRRTKETEMLAGKVSSQKALTPRSGRHDVYSPTPLNIFCVLFTILCLSLYPRLLTWYYFLCVWKSRPGFSPFYLRVWFTCLSATVSGWSLLFLPFVYIV